MAARLLLGLLLVPVAEVALFITVTARLGFWPTTALLAASALAGVWAARRAGLAAWLRVRARLAEGQPPGADLVDSLVLFAAAVLLLMPGFLTDAVALVCLFPPTRALVRRALARRFETGLRSGAIRVATASGPFAGSFSGPLGGTLHVGPDLFHGETEDGEIEDAEVVDDGRPRARLR